MISDDLLKRMRAGGTTLRDVATIEKVLGGAAPVCRAKYISRCCDGPVDVYHGRIQNKDGSPYSGGADWSVPVIRRCVLCGKECEGYYKPGTEPPASSPEGA